MGQVTKLYRLITFGDADMNGDPLVWGNRYLQERLEPDGAGSILTFGFTELLSLPWVKQPISRSKSSEGAYTSVELADGSRVDYHHRAPSDMVADTWTMSLEAVPKEDGDAVIRFFDKCGNHTLIRADDPDGNVIYGRFDGALGVRWNVRNYNFDMTIRQEPGVTQLE